MDPSERWFRAADTRAYAGSVPDQRRLAVVQHRQPIAAARAVDADVDCAWRLRWFALVSHGTDSVFADPKPVVDAKSLDAVHKGGPTDAFFKPRSSRRYVLVLLSSRPLLPSPLSSSTTRKLTILLQTSAKSSSRPPSFSSLTSPFSTIATPSARKRGSTVGSGRRRSRRPRGRRVRRRRRGSTRLLEQGARLRRACEGRHYIGRVAVGLLSALLRGSSFGL